MPLAHGAHGPPAGPVYPALQAHTVCAELPAGETALAGHGVQAVAPNVAEYVLAPQLVHVAEPVVVLYVPATQATHGTFFAGTEPGTSISIICM